MFSLRAARSSAEGGDKFSDVGLLIGIANQSLKGHASFSTGIAKTSGSRYRETDAKKYIIYPKGKELILIQ